MNAFSSAGELVGEVGARDVGGGQPQSLVFTPDGRLLAVVIKQRIEDKSPWRAYVTELHLDGRGHGPMRPVARSPGGGNAYLESGFAEDGSGAVVWSYDGRAATYSTSRPAGVPRWSSHAATRPACGSS